MLNFTIPIFPQPFQYLYWEFAFVMSVFWGLYAIWYGAQKDIETQIVSEMEIKSTKKTITKWTKEESNKGLLESCKSSGTWGSTGAFLSDFLLSFIGWISLYIFIGNYCNKELSNLNIFLALVGIICISGYGFKISEKINQFSK